MPWFGALSVACAMALGLAASGSSTPAAANGAFTHSRALPTATDRHLAARILRAHNDERHRLRLQPRDEGALFAHAQPLPGAEGDEHADAPGSSSLPQAQAARKTLRRS